MKKFLSFLTVLVLAVSMMVPFPITVSAESSGTTGDCTWTLADGVLTISGNGAMADYDYWYDEYAPWYGAYFEKVNISDGVTKIGAGAFAECYDLTSVVIPKSVTAIGSYAFECCDCLEEVHIEDVGAWCQIDFADGIFYYETDLYLNGTLVVDLVIPQGTAKINDYAFASYKGLTSVQIPEGVTSIGNYAFSNCNGLSSVTIPSSVTTIGNNAFYYCYNLTSVTIPYGVTTIGNTAFAFCYNLEPVTIPDSVTTIGQQAFLDCTNFEEVTIPASVTKIGLAAFSRCDNMARFQVDEENTMYSSVDGVLFSKDQKTLIAYPGGKEDTTYTIPETVTVIGEDAFNQCRYLTEVIIPDSVLTIKSDAFSSCQQLNSVVIGNGVKTIEDGAFIANPNLKELKIPAGVETIEEDALDVSLIWVHEGTAGHEYAKNYSGWVDCKVENHIAEWENTVPSTCTVAGNRTGVCTVCGKEVSEELPLAAHTPEGETVTVAPTCTTTGTESGYCAVCEEEYTVVLPKSAHTYADEKCTLCGCPELRSEHPYANDMDQEWVYQEEGALNIAVTFSENTEVEKGFDFIKIYDTYGRLEGSYTGMALAGKTIYLHGDTCKIQLTSDSGVTAYGFEVEAIEALTPDMGKAVQLLRWVDHYAGEKNDLADANGDGKVSVYDAIYFLRKVSNLITDVKIATFNIKSAQLSSLDAVAEVIKEVDADIIGLQEVDKIVKRTGYVDQLKVLAEKAGYQYYSFSPAVIWASGRPSAQDTTLTEGLYGHGILSRYPIESSEIIWPEAQTQVEGGEVRNILRCEVNVDGKKLAVYNAHLDFTQGRYQYKEVQDDYMTKDQYAVFIGDLNETITELKGADCVNTNQVEFLTSTNTGVDHIIVSKDTIKGHAIGLNYATSMMVDTKSDNTSDHNLFYSILEF